MNTQLSVSALLIVNFCIATGCLAQANSAEQTSVDVATQTADKLINELEQNERVMYELFNGLNSSDEYDVTCRRERVEALDRSIQFCEPVFLQKIRQQVDAEITQASSVRTGFFARIRDAFVSKGARKEERVRERSAASIKLMQQEMEALASANPELAASLQAVGQSLSAYLATVATANARSNYLMRQNDPTYGQVFSSGGRTTEPRPTLGAPPPGHTQPSIRFPADVSPRFRP